MIRVLALVLCSSALVSAVACGEDGGDPDRLLRLGSGQYTEGEFRSLIRESIANDDELFEILCAALDGLSDDDAAAAYVQSYSAASPSLELVIADEKRAVQIQREECEAAGLA